MGVVVMTGVDGPVHQFLVQGDSSKYDPFEIALKIARNIRALSESKETFVIDDVVDEDWEKYAADEKMAVLQGAWKLPDVYTGNATRYVNPACPHRERYADVVIACECGASMARAESLEGETKIRNEFNHTDDCKSSWRLRARADVWDRREEILRESLVLGLSGRQLRDRMAYDQESVGAMCERMNIDLNGLKQEYLTRRSFTAVALRWQGHGTSDIAELYGVSANSIRNGIVKWTPYEPQQIYEEVKAQ